MRQRFTLNVGHQFFHIDQQSAVIGVLFKSKAMKDMICMSYPLLSNVA